MSKFILVFLLVLLSGCFGGSNPTIPEVCPDQPYAIWFEDNNMGVANGIPPDFWSKFDDPRWGETLNNIDVYMLRAGVVDDKLIRKLKDMDVEIAIDAVGATWMQNRKGFYQQEIKKLQKWKNLGLDINYISLQSVLSKKAREGEYSMDQRLKDVITYIDAASKIYPDAKFGIIDALPSHGKDWRSIYSRLDIRIDYIHLDIPYELIGQTISWPEVLEIERYVEQSNRKFGFFLTTRDGGNHSNQAFAQMVLSSFRTHQAYCGSPSSYVLAAWFPYPDNTVPTMTDIIKYLADYL